MIVECRNPQLIKDIITVPELWDNISEDDQNPDLWEPDLTEAWLAAIDDKNEVIGFYNLHVRNSVTLQIHPMILPTRRGKWAYKTALQALKWVNEYTTFQKVVCEIPVIYPHVKMFAMQCGMVKEGINRRSFLKYGKIHDMWVLGITKDEITERCHEQDRKNAIRRH